MDDQLGPAAAPTKTLALLRLPLLRRLIAVRVLSQAGDGAFQGALVSAVLFNPTRESTAGAIAAAFAVLLLPYSMIGPFAGALLDRWSRRAVIVGATTVRAALVVGAAALLAVGSPSWVLLVAALFVTGAARFVGSGLSASLPHTVPPGTLVSANTLAVTCGAIATVLGASYAIGLRALVGHTDGPVALVTGSVAVIYLLAARVAQVFPRAALGPDRTDQTAPAQTMRAIAAGFVTALRHVRHRPTVAAAISLIVTVRFCLGAVTLVILLAYQHYFTAPVGPLRPGLTGVGEILAGMSVGLFLGAVLTPPLVRWVGRRVAIVGLMLVAGVTIAVAGSVFTLLSVTIAAPILSLCYQAVKVCVDAIAQEDSDDAFVGRVFALYDTANNVFYVAAFAVGATFLPADGHSPVTVIGIAGVYLACAVGYGLALRRNDRR